MTLLAPIAGLAALAAGLPLLLLMYFLKLRRRPVRVGSTMLWTQAAQDLQVNVPFRMIRPSWLLLIHLIALLLVVLGIARPAIDTGAPAADHVVIVIDHSASMRAVDSTGGPTRLERARDRAAAIIESTRRGATRPTISVIASAWDAVLIERETTSIARARGAIATIEPTDQPGRNTPLSDLLTTLTRRDDGDGEAVRGLTCAVYVIGDGGGLAAGEPPIVAPGCSIVYETVPEDIGEAAANMGITAAAATRDIDDPALLRLFARVESTLDREAATAVSVRRDGQELLLDTVRVPAAMRDEPAEGIWTASIRDALGGPMEFVLTRPDALASDNTASLVVPPLRSPAIAVVAASGGPGGPKPSAFLMDVLSAMTTRAVRVVSAETFATTGAGGADLVIFDGVAPASRGATPQLIIGACPAELVPKDGAAEANGTDFVAGKVRPMAGGPSPVVSWQRAHPLLRDAPLGDVVIGAACPLPEPEFSAEAAWYEVIARGPEGPLMLARDDQPRRVIVGFPLGASNWRLTVGFPLFLVAAVDWLLADGGSQTEASWSTTREPVRVTFPMAAGESAMLRGPIERSVRIDTSRREASVGVLPLAGLYSLESGGASRAVGVNLFDSGETAARITTVEDGQTASARGGIAADAGETQRRELWPWLLLAVVALLTAEWLVYAWQMRGS